MPKLPYNTDKKTEINVEITNFDEETENSFKNILYNIDKNVKKSLEYQSKTRQ